MTPPTSDSSTSASLTRGWVRGGSLFGSVMAGMVLGLLADKWLGTDPWFVVIGILAGSYSGFVRLWVDSKAMEDGPVDR